MDGQSATQGDSDRPKNMDRRRIAIAAALVMMGAVVLDPALLDDMNVSVQLGGNSSSGEPMDEFAQIEYMLSQAEDSSRPASKPPVDAVVEVAQLDTTEATEVQPTESLGALMIPPQAMPNETVEYPDVAISNSVASTDPVSTISPPQAVEMPTRSLSIPSSTVVSEPSVRGANSKLPAMTIRFTGTIAPIQ